MLMTFCPDCQRYHDEGMCEENPWREPAPTVQPETQPALLPRPSLPKLSTAFDQWTKTYEAYLAEFAVETNGVPTKAHVRRAEELADREMRIAFNR